MEQAVRFTRVKRVNMNGNHLIIKKIDSMLEHYETLLVAIDGNSGAGKSTLASFLYGKYDCNLFHMDDFFLPPDLKTAERLEEPGGNIDYLRFKQEVIKGLISGRNFQYKIYNCKEMEFSKAVKVTPKRLNIIEGAYSMHPSLMDFYNLKIFLHIDSEEQKRRIMKRSGPFIYERFINEWIPMENKYFQEFKIMERSDLFIV